MKVIFEYTDYREYLSDYYNDQKEKHSYFSYRYFSNRAGFKSKDFIYRVIKGTKNISRSSCFKISEAIKHTNAESEYFENLVGFNQSKNHKEKDYYYQKLFQISKKATNNSEAALITHDKYELFSKWYHLVIRSLLDLYEFKGNFRWLATMVYPPISESVARKSVELLQRLGLVTVDDDGVYKVVHKHISTSDNVKRLALQSYYTECMELAVGAIDTVPRDRRNISGMTLGISKEGYDEIVEKLIEFRKEIIAIADSNSDANSVYNFNFLLYPVSKSR